MEGKGGKARVFHEVHCEKHGHQPAKKNTHKQLKTGLPRNKRERLYGGCPLCKRENTD